MLDGDVRSPRYKVPRGTSCHSFHCVSQALEVGKIVDSFSPSAPCVAPSNSMRPSVCNLSNREGLGTTAEEGQKYVAQGTLLNSKVDSHLVRAGL